MIEVIVEDTLIKEIEQKLGNLSKKAPAVLKKAVNDTAKQARKRMAKEAKKKYVLKVRSFNESMKIKKATVQKPEAIINSKGKMQELMDFRVSHTEYTTGNDRPEMIQGKVKKGGSLKDLEIKGIKAFITRFANGHIAIVRRVKGEQYEGKGAEERKKKYGKKIDLTKIEKLLSPSIPQILGNEKEVYAIVEPDIAEMLHANIEKHINALLEG